MVTEIAETTMRGTKLFEDILEAWLAGKRGIWIEGGTEASKTWSAMQFLKLICENHRQPLHVSVMSETMPHLKQGAMLDFKNIMGDEFNDNWWNKTDFIYTWASTGSWLHFFSADMPSKVKGPRRDVLFVNEANHLDRDTFRHADWRTRLFTIADWNPESAFWFHQEECVKDENDEYVLKDDSRVYIKRITYLDALEVMSPGKREELEKWESKDPNYWRIYGLGLLGKITGLVYPNFGQVDELPDAPKFYGLDFGFSADPTVLTAHCIVGDKLYSQEMFYDDTGLTNNQISMKMQLLGINRQASIYADPNEPKSAEELRQLGWNMRDTIKGKGSVEFGVKAVNNYFQHWTKDSLNCIKEQRNFRFIKKRDPITGNEYLSDDTTHSWSHGMDSRRYAVASHRPEASSIDLSPSVNYLRPSRELSILESLRR